MQRWKGHCQTILIIIASFAAAKPDHADDVQLLDVLLCYCYTYSVSVTVTLTVLVFGSAFV